MEKIPPIEKIAEAYTAIEDKRIKLYKNYATVLSSNKQKEYLIKWKNNLYYSNDNSTYWQGYMGYPVLAVLMLQGVLPLNKKISQYFKNINWNELNKKHKKNYKNSLEEVLQNISKETRVEIDKEINHVHDNIKTTNIELTKKKNLGEKE